MARSTLTLLALCLTLVASACSESPKVQSTTDVIDVAGDTSGGLDTAGTDTQGMDTQGTDTTGVDTAGVDTAGVDTAGGDTTDVGTEPCGGCAAGQVCSDGACVCVEGFADCDSDVGNGCETDINTPEVCGACDAMPCGANTACEAGQCACADGFEDCDNNLANGCETDLNTPETCGACDVACGANMACDSGSCVCENTYGDCDGDMSNGCEEDLNVSEFHCGACNAACVNDIIGTTDASCDAGTCNWTECGFDFRDCNEVYADGCEVNVVNDAENCGACDNVCTVGTQVVSVACTPKVNEFLGSCFNDQCVEGFGDCDDVFDNGCEDPLVSVVHCGACDNDCSLQTDNADAVICNSQIECDYDTCKDDFGDCDGDRTNGCETPLLEDENHCGACNNACEVDEHCHEGVCDRYVQVAAGKDFTCLRRQLGDLVCWGDNRTSIFGSLSVPRSTQSYPREAGTDGIIFTSLSTFPTRQAICGLASGTPYCWGDNSPVYTTVAGERTGSLLPQLTCDNPATCLAFIDTPRRLTSAIDWEKIDLGFDTGLLLDSSGGVYKWGWEGSQPAQLAAVPNMPAAMEDIAAGADHWCVVDSNGSLGPAYCWGANNSGQLGTGGTSPQTNPTQINGAFYTEIDAGEVHNCAFSAGQFGCWGSNATGQQGQGNQGGNQLSYKSLPSGSPKITTYALGFDVTCGVEEGTGQLYCWGDNDNGLLGVPPSTLTGSGSPVAIAGLTDVVDVSVGERHACALQSTGDVWCWGNNEQGMLGDGNTSSSTELFAPIQVPRLK